MILKMIPGLLGLLILAVVGFFASERERCQHSWQEPLKHSRDSSVRKDHQILEGTRQKYADPPIVDQRTEARGNPGTWYQCRCVAVPVLPELSE